MVYKQDQDTLLYTGKDYPHKGNISFVEQNEMTYSPVAMVYGTGYYARNPIVYNSKLKERTEAKNYDGSNCNYPKDGDAVSMVHQIEYASAFVKDIGVRLENIEKSPKKVEVDILNRTTGEPTGKTKWVSTYSSKPQNGLSSTSMSIEEEVTEGSVHVGQLLTTKGEGWKNPLIEIDENYVGTFKITKNMEVCTSCTGSKPRKDWLSCCFGGYDRMDDEDKMWDEEEIFDCTCRDVTWGDSWNDTTKAQYCKEC